MEWQDRFSESIEYIEAHLVSYDTLSKAEMIKEAAKHVNLSCYDYQRVFSAIMGTPPGEYIRRRRLTLAAIELQEGITRITDVALKYGYESLEAFSRAFKNIHGVSPSHAFGGRGEIQGYPKLSIQWNLKNQPDTKCLIIEKEAFNLFGVSTLIGSEGTFADVPTLWAVYDNDGTLDRLNAALGRPRRSCLHAAVYGHTQNSFRYMIGMYLPAPGDISPMYERLSVPGGLWAVFTVPRVDLPAWSSIYRHWLPSSGYELAPRPSFEMYYGYANHENVLTEIWIPIRKQIP